MWHSAENPSTHHLLLLLQNDGLPRSLPQPEGLIMRRGDDVVSIGADSQAPDLTMMTLRNIRGSKLKNSQGYERVCNNATVQIHLCLWLHWLGLKQKQTAAYVMQSAFAAYWLGSYYNSNPFNITASSTLATFGNLIPAMEKCLLNAFQLLEKVTSNVWMWSNLSASHCLIFLSFPAVKNRWVLGTNWRNMTLERKDNRERTVDDK